MQTPPDDRTDTPGKRTQGIRTDERARAIERENEPGMDWRPTGQALNRPGAHIGGEARWQQSQRVGNFNSGEKSGARRGLTTGLGVFSFGLGISELAMPDAFSRAIGVHTPRAGLVRAFGAREIAAGIGLLSGRRPAWAMWSRVAGDLIDLGALALSLRAERNQRRRLGAATAAVAGVLALDVAGAIWLSRRAMLSRAELAPSFIVNKPLEACFVFFQDNLNQFLRAPLSNAPCAAEITSITRNQSVAFKMSVAKTEISAEAWFERAPRGATRVTLSPTVRNARENLRRFKNLIEAGEIPTTHGQPTGPRSLTGHIIEGVEQ